MGMNAVNAQQSSPCNDIYDCNECLNQPDTQCVFAVGVCQPTCTENPQNGATCYSTQTFTDVVTPDSICDLYNSDNARCTGASKSCTNCIATLKSDGKPCQWYESAKACFGGGTGPFGSGELTCPTSAPGTTAPAPTPLVPRPTPLPQPQATSPPTLLALEDQANCQVQMDCASCTSTQLSDGVGSCFWFPASGECDVNLNGQGVLTCDDAAAGTESPVLPDVLVCQQADGCASCLEANCAWSPDGTDAGSNCAPSCSNFPADDIDCYSMTTTAGADATMTPSSICEMATSNVADRELCFAQMDCSSCTSTIKSDGINTCKWYTDTDNGVEWCQTGNGCDMNGICGSDTCDAADGTDGDTTATDDGNGNATMPTDCNDFDGYGADGCVPCLSSPNNCAWVLETCVPNCDDIANNPGGTCYSSSQFPDTPPETICQQAAAHGGGSGSAENGNGSSASPEDVALCGSKNYCFTCTSTIKSDGSETCSWYSNPATGEEWCGVGGCDPTRDGICGSSDEAVCQQPEEDDEDDGEDSDASSGGSDESSSTEGQSSSDNSSAGSTISGRRASLLFSTSSFIVSSLLVLNLV